MNSACGICGQYAKPICVKCSNVNDQDLQKQINQLKRANEGLEIWVNELLERLAVQLANDSFRAIKKEEG